MKNEWFTMLKTLIYKGIMKHIFTLWKWSSNHFKNNDQNDQNLKNKIYGSPIYKCIYIYISLAIDAYPTTTKISLYFLFPVLLLIRFTELLPKDYLVLDISFFKKKIMVGNIDKWEI